MTNKLTRVSRRIALLAGLTACGFQAAAHQVWIEQPAAGAKDGQAVLYFGEFGENLREASPGLLDKFVRPVARRLSGQTGQPVELKKTASGFALSVRAAKGESLVAEEPAYPISERKEGDASVRSLYHPAARLVTDLKQQPPQLTLDLVPTGASGAQGHEFQVFYKGQPLPKAKVAVVTASGWAQEHHTDDSGKFSVHMPWQGTYVLEVSHGDKTPGERPSAAGTEKFDRATYVTSLTVVQDKGLAPLPAAPAAPPNKLN